MVYYDLESETGICPSCGNHFGYGVVINGVCEECYISQQMEQSTPECEEWEYFGFKTKEEFEKWRRENENS